MTLLARRRARANPIPDDHRRVSEAAIMTGLNPSTIHKWIREGKITPYIHGSMRYVNIEDVTALQQFNRKRLVTPDPLPADMVTVRRASAATGASIQSIQTWARTGRIKAQRHGSKMWYVNLDDVYYTVNNIKTGPHRYRDAND